MARRTIRDQGSFTARDKKAINDNFSDLYGTSVGGTLTSAHVMVGNSSNVATDTAMTGDVSITNAGVTSISAGLTSAKVPVGVAAGYKIARGITALGGTNPTTVASGLTTVTGLALTLDRNSSLASGTAFVTYHNISGGSFDMYGWVLAGTASSGVENVAWVAIGT
jgi:hypothetical protein